MPTTGISLVREHTAQMQLPRFLWVPFELGRPFGAPNAPGFQKRVLRTTLELFERRDGPVVLEHFPDDAPEAMGGNEEGAAWACPVTFQPAEEERAEIVAATLDQMVRLEPWYEIHVERRGNAVPFVSGLGRREIAMGLGEVATGARAPDVGSELALGEWVRLGCDDLRNWYLDAAHGQPGRASPGALRDWFWLQTAAARLIASAARALAEHPDPLVKVLALRAMVPREYLPALLPELATQSWRQK